MVPLDLLYPVRSAVLNRSAPELAYCDMANLTQTIGRDGTFSRCAMRTVPEILAKQGRMSVCTDLENVFAEGLRRTIHLNMLWIHSVNQLVH